MIKLLEKWKASGLSQLSFCKRENISKSTFGYWYRKYKKEKGLLSEEPQKANQAFIPVEMPGNRSTKDMLPTSSRIEVSFPNGVRVSCPVGIDIQQLKTLIKI